MTVQKYSEFLGPVWSRITHCLLVDSVQPGPAPGQYLVTVLFGDHEMRHLPIIVLVACFTAPVFCAEDRDSEEVKRIIQKALDAQRA